MFFVKSNEKHVCPVCGGTLISRDSRQRKVILPNGEKAAIQIRRLQCKDCKKLHSELPDFIHPYRHYSSDTIQAVLDGKKEACPAEDSTIRRWIQAFQRVLSSIESALIGVWMQETGIPWNLIRRVSLLENIKKCHPKNWLAFVNQRLLSFGFTPYTQFAFCPEPPHDTLASNDKRKRGQVP